MNNDGSLPSRLPLPPLPLRLFFGGLLSLAVVALVVALNNRGTGPASPVEGIVVSVESESLTNVKHFTLRLADGSTLEFKVGILENATEFSPSHLSEHLATSVPIRVYFARSDGDGERMVYRLEDAEPSPTYPPAAS